MKYIFVVFLLFLSSCGNRPESVEYFNEVTGLKLCKSSVVKNVDSPDAGVGILYIVSIKTTTTCEKDLISQIDAENNLSANRLRSGAAAQGPNISVKKADDLLIVIYTD